MLVAEIDGHTINLRLDNPIELLLRENALDPLHKLAQLGLRIGVVEAGHRLQVLDRLEFLQRLAADSQEPFAVLMLDVDGLKQVNDARGHAAGDAVLKRVASVLSSDLRETDLATRWGGDEFLLLMPGVDQVGALSLARRIGGTLLNPDDPAGPISVSIGTAAFPADGTTAVSLLAAADRSMYVEKRQRVA